MKTFCMNRICGIYANHNNRGPKMKLSLNITSSFFLNKFIILSPEVVIAGQGDQQMTQKPQLHADKLQL